MLVRAIQLQRVWLYLEINCFLLSKYFKQAIDIFISKDPNMSDYRLSADDWTKIKVYAKILEVCFFS